MIKPINITPLNTTSDLYYECDACGDHGTMVCSVINTDSGNLEELGDIDCPQCSKALKDIKV